MLETMADSRPKVVLISPGSVGLSQALREVATDQCWITSTDDSYLTVAKASLTGTELDIEYTPLGSLLTRLCTMAGGLQGRRIAPSQLAAFLTRAARSLSPDSPFAHIKDFPLTVEAIAQVITLLHYHEVSLQELSDKRDQLSPLLAEKVKDLAQLEQLVREMTHEINYEFGVDKAQRLMESPAPVWPIKHIVVIAGHRAAPIYNRLLQWLANNGVQITILVEKSRVSSLFQRQESLTDLGETFDRVSEGWNTCLFGSESSSHGPTPKILEVGDPLSECEWVVRACQKLIAKGTSPLKIGIWTSDQGLYPPMLVSASRRLGMQLNATVNVPLLTAGFAHFTLRVLQVLASNDARQIEKIASSSYLALSNIDRRTLIDLAHQAHHADSPDWEALQTLLQDHRNLSDISGLLNWRSKSKEAATLAIWHGRLRELHIETDILANALFSDQSNSSREENCMTVMQRSIGEAYLKFEPDTVFTLQEFVQMVEETWSNEQCVWSEKKQGVSLITNTRQLKEYDYLFAMNMVEGVMPKRRSEDPILTDKDIHEINQLVNPRLPLPDSIMESTESRDEFVRIAGSARKEITFSYAINKDDRSLIPTFYLDNLKQAYQGEIEATKILRRQLVPPLEDASSYDDRVIALGLAGDRVSVPPPHLVSDEAKQKLIPQDPALTVEEIAGSVICPFRSTMRYRLKLNPPAGRISLARFADVPTETGLCKATSREEATEALQAEIDKRIEALEPRLELWEIKLLRHASKRMIDQWVDNEFQRRSIWEITWDPVTKAQLSDVNLKEKFSNLGHPPVKIKTEFAALGIAETPNREPCVVGIISRSTASISRESDQSKLENMIYLTILRRVKDSNVKYQSALLRIGIGSAISCRTMDPTRAIAKVSGVFETTQIKPVDTKVSIGAKVMSSVKLALDRIFSGYCTPIPGDHCKDCRYADLCRSHLSYGERRDPTKIDGI